MAMKINNPPQIDVTDVNDNPPYISPPEKASVTENSPPGEIARISLKDPDDWSQGHGPPFQMILDPQSPQTILQSVKVQFDKG